MSKSPGDKVVSENYTLVILEELFKGYLCYKTILCHKAAFDV